MPARILTFRRFEDRYETCVLLDDARLDDDGQPLEEWCRRDTWGIDPPEGVEPEAYEQQILVELAGLAREELTSRLAVDEPDVDAGEPLDVEGEVLE